MDETRPSKLRVAWTVARLAGRRVLGRAEGERDDALGEALTDQLDAMKGLAMKVGQIVSYMDVPLPDRVQATMARLQTGASAMSPERTRDVLEAALGARVQDVFDSFDEAPVAAASIGQVHRATWRGEAVAVKVQYPEVATSFADDLRSIDRFASLASLASAVDGRALVREIGERLHEECDYTREAAMQTAFAATFADDPDVVIPRVVPECSTRTVLTTAWMDGVDFDTFRAAATPTERDRVAATLCRFSYRSLLKRCAIQADPHPGNFLFRTDAKVGFLDFGCVRILEPTFVDALRRVILALDEDDRPRFEDAIRAMGLVGRPAKFDYGHFFAMMAHLHRPLLTDDFRFDAAYVREGYAFNGPRSPNARTMAMPPAYIWVARLQWGLWSILARLGATTSLRSFAMDLLRHPVAPLLVPAASPVRTSVT
jgi:predicted unusual protein kinase regulating ubiquinone biosynthesis (AarF/ABC1/UbiB family)